MEKNKYIKIAGLLGLCAMLAFSPVNESEAGSTYKLNNDVNGYVTSDNAKKKINSKVKYKAGEYYIYKQSGGMYNISKTKGSPGAWINPSDNKIVVQNNTTNTNSEKYILNNNVSIYINASDAKNKVNSKGTYSKGEYYVYKSYQSMLNISKNAGSPGAWINPSDNESIKVENTNKPANNDSYEIETPLQQDTLIPVYRDIKVYMNASDAINRRNPIKKYSEGNYYLYKTYNNMMNITKTKGVPGAWINPKENERDYEVEIEYKESEFINKIAPYAQDLAANNDLYASVMIAQAVLESGYGNSTLAKEPNNNLFGVKGNYNGDSVGLQTFEYKPDGSRYKTIAKFKKYPSVKESLEDYVQVLTANNNVNSWRYKFYLGARKSQTSSYKDATSHLTGRYATSPNYGSSLNRIIEEYNLTRFDK